MNTDSITREQVLARWDNMTPRERNALIAEKVMGWTKPDSSAPKRAQWQIGERQFVTEFRPTTDIVDAFEVWENDRPDDWIFELSYLKGQYYAEIIEPYVGVLAKVRAKSAAEAMVKCRLLAKLAVMEE